MSRISQGIVGEPPAVGITWNFAFFAVFAFSALGRKVPCKPRLVRGVKGHNMKRNYLTGKPRPVAGQLPYLMKDECKCRYEDQGKNCHNDKKNDPSIVFFIFHLSPFTSYFMTLFSRQSLSNSF
jgi:hypothetical protein